MAAARSSVGGGVMSKFFTSLVDRNLVPIPESTEFLSHGGARADLPQGVVYQIHTVYLEEGEPRCIAEKVDATTVLTHANPEKFAEAPDSVRVWVSHFDVLWRLIP